MKKFTLQEELEEWIDDNGEGEYKDFSFWSHTSTGHFDSEKGAMYDYKITAKNNVTDELYEGKGGYYTNNGHSFNYPVEFVLQEPKEKKVKSKYINIKLLQDDSSHWYIIPQEVVDDFENQMNYIYDHDDDGIEDIINEFDNKFGKYRTGGDINNYQLCITQEELNRLTK